MKLYQNFGTATTAAPKFGIAVLPVTKWRCWKHVISVRMGLRCV